MHVCEERKVLALVSLYTYVRQDLREESSEALWLVQHHGDNTLTVIDVKDIQAHVAMAPFYSNPHGTAPVLQDVGLYYVGEQIGFEIAELDVLDTLNDQHTVGNENNVASDL